jgi:hypothetical protein
MAGGLSPTASTLNASTFEIEGLGGRLPDDVESPEAPSADDAQAWPVAAASEEHLRALHEQRARYVQRLTNLPEGRRAAGARALERIEAQIMRVEGGMTALGAAAGDDRATEASEPDTPEPGQRRGGGEQPGRGEQRDRAGGGQAPGAAQEAGRPGGRPGDRRRRHPRTPDEGLEAFLKAWGRDIIGAGGQD